MEMLGLRDKPFLKRLVQISLPLMFQQLLNTAMYMADTLMLGALGDVPLAGAGAANQLVYVLDICLFGITGGGGVFMAQHWGKKNVSGIRSTLGLCVMLSFAFCVVFFAAGVLFPMGVTGLFSKEAEVAQSGAIYLKIAAWSYLFKAIIYPYSTAHKSAGNPKLPTITGAIGISVDMVLNYLLIFGKLGFPKLGIAGAAYSTVIGGALDAALLLFFSYYKETPARARLKEFLHQTKADFKRFWEVTLPVFADDAIWALGTVTMSYVYGQMGTQPFAAMMIVNTVDQLTMIALMGLGVGGSVMLGNAMGEGDHKRAHLYGKRFLALSFTVGLFMTVLVALLGTKMPFLYANATAEARNMASTTILSMAFLQPIYGLNFMMIVGILRAGGDTHAAAYIDLLPLWLVSVPLTALLGLVFHAPLWLVYLVAVPASLVRLFFGLRRMKTGRWLKTLV